ncbi:MAG: ribonuclease D [Kiloniellales bacterium]
MTLISDPDQLAAFCERQREAAFVAVDTEFLRDSTYWPKLCLAQVAGPAEAAALDPLAPGMNLEPLFDLLHDPKVLKVFHSGRQDLEIFYLLMKDLPRPIFDTQVAAMVCGFGDSVGYDTLARKLAGVQIDKSSRFTDWSRRPLKKRQIDYALSDVTHLRTVYEHLNKKLEESDRSAWLDEEMSVLNNPETYRLEPASAWQRLKTRGSDPRYLAVLRELAAWRETQAQARDVPRSRVLRDEQIFDIAVHRPTTPEELAQTRGLSADLARGRIGREILAAVAAGLAVPDQELPRVPPRRELPNGTGPVVDLLKVLLKMKSEDFGVAQKLIANVSDLEEIAADDKAEVAALAGWRREIFGRDALALKHGRITLGVKRGKLRLVPRDGGAGEQGAARKEPVN